MDLADAPAPSVAGEGAMAVKIGRDVLHTHRAADAVTLKRKAIKQPDRVGVERVNFELLLDLRAALLGRDDTVADRRKRAVPETLPGILFRPA